MVTLFEYSFILTDRRDSRKAFSVINCDPKIKPTEAKSFPIHIDQYPSAPFDDVDPD